MPPGSPVNVYDSLGGFIGGFETIQAGVDAAPPNGVVRVEDGIYTENVVISAAKSSLTLEATNSRGATIVGVEAGSELGTVQLASGASGVKITGFKIEGINGNGAIEKSAIYLIGTQSGHQIIDKAYPSEAGFSTC
jgi:pectin methylesterase-like acyl-CoA thioesterase